MTKIILLGITFLSSLTWGAESPQVSPCNGQVHLCGMPYDQVTFPMSHNGQSHIGNLLFDLATTTDSNINDQDRRFGLQLRDGIRATKAPVYFDEGMAMACHGISNGTKVEVKAKFCAKWGVIHGLCDKIVDSLGACSIDPAGRSYVKYLSTLKRFLVKHPNEVFTLFIEDYTNDLKLLADGVTESGLSTYIYPAPQSGPWPTLGEMIRDQKRVVIFLDRDFDSKNRRIEEFPFFHSRAQWVWSSRYHFEKLDDLRKDQYDSSRSDRTHLYGGQHFVLMEHFITPWIGGSRRMAKKANQLEFLRDRVDQYRRDLSKKPNFISVDFYEYPKRKPGLFQLVEELNQ